MNEDAVGNAVKQAIEAGICTREELLLHQNYGCKICEHMKQQNRGIENSLKKVDWNILIYIYFIKQWEITLLHGGLWKIAYHKGKLRAIGVSNFYPNILTNFCENCRN